MTLPRDYDHRASRRHPPPHLAEAARDELALLTAWFWVPVRRGLEWLIRSGARPTAATILHLEGGAGQFPQIRAVWRDRAIGGITTLGDPFPESKARERVPVANEETL